MPSVLCTHLRSNDARDVCIHLLHDPDKDYYQYFSGQGVSYALICDTCSAQMPPAEIHSLCAACFRHIEETGCWDGIVGSPEVRDRPSGLRFQHRVVALPAGEAFEFADIQPLEQGSARWLGLNTTNRLVQLQCDQTATAQTIGVVPPAPDGQPFTALQVAPGGRLAAVYQRAGRHGVVVDLESGQPLLPLLRDDYHAEVSPFPIAFVLHNGRVLLIHGTAWNRLDISDPWTGQVLTERGPTAYSRGEDHPEHYLDYFHGQLLVSPDQQWIIDNGWVWSPFGVVASWNLARWRKDNAWESEDGESKHYLCQRAYFWDGPICWIDGRTVAIWGYGDDDEWLLPAVRLFDVGLGREVGWFPGPDVTKVPGQDWSAGFSRQRDSLIFDEYLFSVSTGGGLQVWDVATGERLLADPSLVPIRYHRGTREFLTLLPGAMQLSRLHGNGPVVGEL